MSVPLLYWGIQNWTQHTRCSLTRAEKRRRITSLELLATLCLMQLRMPSALLAVCRFMPSPSCLAENRPDTCFPPVCTHLQTLQRMALQSRQPASSEPMGALHQNPWTVECPVCSRILWPNPPSPKVTPCLLQPFLLVSETQDS